MSPERHLMAVSSVRRLRQLASTDPLTGLANRRAFDIAIDAEIARSSRSGRPFVLLYVDVDFLKHINDRFGHRAGDIAVRRVANALRVTCRRTDVPARIGGDEFAVVLHRADADAALQFIARLRAVLTWHQRGGAVSVTVGAAEYLRDGATSEELLDAADAALYEAKRHRIMRPPFMRTPPRSAMTHQHQLG